MDPFRVRASPLTGYSTDWVPIEESGGSRSPAERHQHRDQVERDRRDDGFGVLRPWEDDVPGLGALVRTYIPQGWVLSLH